ncbi:MAG: bifunctional folylpolyglutamate synthase/dihydrofolate synthase [Firmicutes bacterium]|nr:folylpolyglutamate synthase/dihydrofolate synthase family protein [Bacillota bacterium]NLL88303.1 bifunctional folylpolyglutamate synthase/dihydrofolate synthase [Bacillota bacterium]
MNKAHPFSNRKRFTSHLGLERFAGLCARLGNPQAQFRAIHIAGTNGKGSTAALIAGVLQAHGFRVGLFTSPHLIDYRERFQINGQKIPEEDLGRISALVKEQMLGLEAEYPEGGAFTQFEAAAAVGFTYFAREQVDYGVIEVGLGGRLDATNVLTPEISVITPVGHDHLERLGPTIEDVAREKAGIIKAGVPVVAAPQLSAVDQVLRTAAAKLGAPYHSLDQTRWQPLEWDLEGGALVYPILGRTPFRIQLPGKHQLDNAATALLALKVLQERGFPLQPHRAREGMAGCRWPGRLQITSRNPLVIFDGAHNREGFLVLADSLRHLSEEKFTFVIGLSAGKDPAVIDSLLPLAKRVFATESRNSRIGAVPASELTDYVRSRGISADCVDFYRLPPVLKMDDPVCVCGSLYLIGDLQALIVRNHEGYLPTKT